MLHSRIFSFLMLIIFLASCEKDELTKPVDVQFKFKLGQEAQDTEHFKFNSGTLSLQEVFLIGQREKGEDISFTSDFESLIEADLATGNTIPQVVFNLPQGGYRSIYVIVTPGAPIVINGLYKNSIIFGPNIPIRLELDIPDVEVMLQAEQGSEMILDKRSGAIAEIYFNPAAWFETIPLVALDNLDLHPVNGVPSIVISKSSNVELYGKITGEVPLAIKGIIR